MIFKIMKGMLPTYLFNIINVKTTPINIRCQYILNIPKFKTVTYGKTVLYIMHLITGISAK